MNEMNNDAMSEKAASFGWIGKLSSDRKSQNMSQRQKSLFVQDYINNNSIGLKKISNKLRNLVSDNNGEFIFYLLVSDEANQKDGNLWWGAQPYDKLPEDLMEKVERENLYENSYYVFISILSKPEDYEKKPFLHYVSLNTIRQNESLKKKIEFHTTEAKLKDEKTKTIKLSLSKQEADDYNEIKYQLLFGKLDEAIQAICQRNNNNNNEKTGENNGTDNQHII